MTAVAIARPGTAPEPPTGPPIAVLPAVRSAPVALHPFLDAELDRWTDPRFVQEPLDIPLGRARARHDAHLGADPDFGPQPTRRADLPDAHATTARIALAALEVMRGRRPAAQLLRCTSPEVYETLARRGSTAARRAAARRPSARAGEGRRVRIRRIVLCHPADDAVEATVILDEGDRVRAMAMRLEGRDGRWVVQALQIA